MAMKGFRCLPAATKDIRPDITLQRTPLILRCRERHVSQEYGFGERSAVIATGHTCEQRLACARSPVMSTVKSVGAT